MQMQLGVCDTGSALIILVVSLSLSFIVSSLCRCRCVIVVVVRCIVIVSLSLCRVVSLSCCHCVVVVHENRRHERRSKKRGTRAREMAHCMEQEGWYTRDGTSHGGREIAHERRRDKSSVFDQCCRSEWTVSNNALARAALQG